MSLRNATASFELRRAGSRARNVRRLKSAGFTLVELLVVISIIGMLMALLLPAINSARETGRQNTCRSNLSNLATAILLYDGRNGKCPGYMNCLITQQGNAYKDPTTGTLTPVSWAVELLSDLDRGALYEIWRTDYLSGGGSSGGSGGGGGGSSGYIPSTKVYLEILTCPSDDANRAGTPLSYVVNTGVKDLTQSQPATSGSSGSGSGSSATVGYPRDWQANGMFFDNYSDDKLIKTTVSTRGPQIVMRLTGVRDPKDKTILFTENVDGGDYTFDSTTSGGTTFPYAEIQLGCIWDATSTVSNQSATPPTLTPSLQEYRMNVGLGRGDGVQYQFCRPSSRHPQGVNIAFAGKNVSFVRDTLSYFVMAKLMASDDAAIKAPGQQVLFDQALRMYQINDADLNP